MRRLDIPRQLERQVRIEAGDRCAIPTCRQTPIEVAHIVPWREGHEHKFENLIALCPTCHARYDKGDIDRKSMQQYKANLFLLNNRYGDLERRVLMLFAKQPHANQVKLPGGNLIFLMYLLDDGYLEYLASSSDKNEDEFPNYDIYRLTESGREFIQRWLNAQGLD